MDKYYERLLDTQKALKDAGLEGTTFYKRLSKEITELTPEYENFIKTNKEALQTFAEGFDSVVTSGENTKLNDLLFGDMSDYVRGSHHAILLDEIAKMYDISTEDAEYILRTSDVAGASERLYQK
jgi:hypothetical protein